VLNNKQNKNTNPIISRQDYHLTQPCPSEEKQTTNKTKARCQVGNKAMKIKVKNMLRGKKRKNRYAELNRGRCRRFIYIID